MPFDWGWTIHYGLTVFIVGDLLKIAADAAILDPRAPWGRLFDRIRFPDRPVAPLGATDSASGTMQFRQILSVTGRTPDAGSNTQRPVVPVTRK